MPAGRWTHVATTWSPNGSLRLYVDGVSRATSAAPRYAASGEPMYIASGSRNVGGELCWRGVIAAGSFDGDVADPRVFDAELDAAQIARIAAAHP